MKTTICNQKRDTIAVARNPEWIEGKTSEFPFVVMLVFGDFKREYPMTSFEKACEVASRMGNDYHINYILETGIDPEYDEFWK